MFVYEQPPTLFRSPKSKWHDSQRRVCEAGKMYWEKHSLLDKTTSWRSCSVVPRGCVNRIRLSLLLRDDHSAILIGAGWRHRSDWPARVLANDVSTRIDRLHPCRDKWRLNTTLSSCLLYERGVGAWVVAGRRRSLTASPQLAQSELY